jgi:hypothetical protein
MARTRGHPPGSRSHRHQMAVERWQLYRRSRKQSPTACRSPNNIAPPCRPWAVRSSPPIRCRRCRLHLGLEPPFADESSNTLWACFSSAHGSNHGAAQAASALHAFDLQTGTLKARYALPTAGAFCNDIAIGPDGATYVTDSNNMQVDRLAKGGRQLQVWAGDGAFGPTGGILDGISILDNRVFVNTLTTSRIFSILIDGDGKSGTIAEVLLGRPIERPDGMRRFGNDHILLVEGGGMGRLSRLTDSRRYGRAHYIEGRVSRRAGVRRRRGHDWLRPRGSAQDAVWSGGSERDSKALSCHCRGGGHTLSAPWRQHL